MKTWMSQKENRRLALLVAGTFGLTAAFTACPPSWTSVLPVWKSAAASRMRRI
ncbi:MAG: hypothetical protein SPL39_11090 [Selenomonadaceae bacterium]|nr:hypothetical protein [Selenomonadaceae bacterium]